MFIKRKHKNFGLALGGGAARGIAHIGLIQRLEEYNIQPKIITGTSMGSIVAALYALGIPSNKMLTIAKELSLLKVLNFNPLTDIISRDTVREVLDPYIGAATFHDTNIPLEIIATHLETGEIQIFSSGKIIEAILASIAIPGIFSPYFLNENHYIDGGVVENLPLSPLRGIPTIASSVLLPNGSDISQQGFLTRGFKVLNGVYTIFLHQQESLNRKLHHKPIHLLSLSDNQVGYMDFGDAIPLTDEMYNISQSIQDFIQIPKK